MNSYLVSVCGRDLILALAPQHTYRLLIKHLLIFGLVLGLMPVSLTNAAAISWGSAQNISADSDVSTTGTLLYAYNPSANTSTATPTVNGVPFVSELVPDLVLGDPNDPDINLALDPNNGFDRDFYNANAGPADLTGDYQFMMRGAANVPASVSGSSTVELQKLLFGTEYLVQLWVNDSRQSATEGYGGRNNFDPNVPGKIVNVDSTVELRQNVATYDGTGTGSLNSGSGGAGQYVIGTFTADATTQTITLDTFDPNSVASNNLILNAIQVRVIPEPMALVLASVACGIGLATSRRRRP